MPGLDEEVIEAAFWHFYAEFRRTGAMRDAFKRQLRQVIHAHTGALVATLADAETYVRAYKCQCDAPAGIPGASRCLRRIGDICQKYARHNDVATN